MYVRMYVCMYVRMHACMHACVNVCIYACVYMSMFLSIYVCIYVCMSDVGNYYGPFAALRALSSSTQRHWVPAKAVGDYVDLESTHTICASARHMKVAGHAVGDFGLVVAQAMRNHKELAR